MRIKYLFLFIPLLLAGCNGLTPVKQSDDKVQTDSVTANDVTLSGVVDLQGDTIITANRLYIKKDAVVSSYRFKLTIHANEIIADGGLIQDYPIGFEDCSVNGYMGIKAPGGDIEVRAVKAEGSALFSLVGAQGCSRSTNNGTDGGNLRMQIDEGERFIPSVKLSQALGRSNGGWPVTNGKAGTSCVSLSKDDGHACL